MRKSASSAISSARRRARSESPPQAFAWMRQAMRRNRNCLWLDRESSPKTSRYLSLSCAVVRLRRPSISSLIRVGSTAVSFLMALTSSHMRALYLRQVNLLAGRIGEEQADECIAEDGGDFGNGAVEGGVAIAHERSPWKTTHDDLRLAVDASSGGCDRRGVVPCPLTIYAGRVRVVRPGVPVYAAYERT